MKRRRLPTTREGWASLTLGLGLFFLGIAHWLQGAENQAFVDWAGAFGTLGLPSLKGSGWHVEIVKDDR